MKVSELFHVSYGTSLGLNNCKKIKNGINFVSRTFKNNGVSASIKPIPEIEPFEAGLITVASSGSIMSSFVQNKPFYTGYHIFCLKPKKPMTLQEKIFYCVCLRNNKYRFSYGRQANQSLRKLELPDKIPEWVNEIVIDEIIAKEPHHQKTINLSDRKWAVFEIKELFTFKRGRLSGLKNDLDVGTRVISATTENNGFSCFIDTKPEYVGNVFTIANTGQGSVGVVFYQSTPFTPSNNITVLIPKFNLNEKIAMFLLPLFKKERYRLSFGRILNEKRLGKYSIKLPVDKNNHPDWKFMEDYIKSLPYSSNLETKVVSS